VKSISNAGTYEPGRGGAGVFKGGTLNYSA